MFQFNLFKSRSFIGLDIQANEVRLLQLRRTTNKLCIEQAAVMDLSKDAIVDGKIQQFGRVNDALRELVQRTRTQGEETAIALPARSIISKKVQLPTELDEFEREAEIMENLSQYFPGVTGELSYDYSILGPHDSAYDNVLVVATRSEQLLSYVGVVERAGLQVRFVDVDIYALTRAVQFALASESRLQLITVLDTTQLIVMHHQEIISHQQFMPGHSHEICTQLKSALQLCCSHHRELDIKEIFLSRTMRDMPEIITFIHEVLMLKTKYINPFDLFLSSTALDSKRIENISSRMLISCGLALRGNNA